MIDQELKKGDVIQITAITHHWYPALCIVDEVKSWGCQAYMIMVTSNDPAEPNNPAYIRLKENEYEYVGPAPLQVL